LSDIYHLFTAILKPLDAYVAYGYISNNSVVELVHRRAYTVLEGVRKPLSDNITVEKALGDKDILCLNDLTHEIYSVGPHFEESLKVICPFKLACPVGNYEKKILNINDKVEERGGFLADGMEDFINKIL
jgi:large subunit ribosomal protein L7e